MKYKTITYTPTPADFDMLIEVEKRVPGVGTCRMSETMRIQGGFLLYPVRKQWATLRNLGRMGKFKVISYRLPTYSPPIILP